ncbi:MAG: NAD(P)/FAD-dependent oxidoreductase [Rhizobiaceae bacterium]
MKSFDAIIIGAGHNGLAAAALLASGGRKVLVCETADGPGGMARELAFAPGFKAPGLAGWSDSLSPGLIRKLALERHGLKRATTPGTLTALAAGTSPLMLSANYETLPSTDLTGNRDEWSELLARLGFQASILARFLETVPPGPGASTWPARRQALTAGLKLRLGGKEELRQFLRMILMPVWDIADEVVRDERLKGLLGSDATLGTALGPRSPTSILGLYYRLALARRDQDRNPVLVSTLGPALEASAKAAGVEIRYGAGVASILVENRSVTGVVTTGGETFKAGTVLSAVHPARTILELAGPVHFDAGLVRDIRNMRSKGNVSKMLLALDKLPAFEGVGARQLSGRLVAAGTSDEVERSYNPSKYGELPANPPLHITIPSIGDSALAPAGAAVVSVTIQNTAHDLREGWKKGVPRLEKTVMNKLEGLSPGISRSVVSSQLMTPVDIASQFATPGGHWHHGEFQVDRLYSLRPVFGLGGYATPLKGLWLCGAGTHPGGGLNATSAMNAVSAIKAAGG